VLLFRQNSACRQRICSPAELPFINVTTFNSLHAPDNKALSSWWSPFNFYKQDAGWEQKRKVARANGISVREWGRNLNADHVQSWKVEDLRGM
jgi:hypothetical protein